VGRLDGLAMSQNEDSLTLIAGEDLLQGASGAIQVRTPGLLMGADRPCREAA
jgi:hypothetical protein